MKGWFALWVFLGGTLLSDVLSSDPPLRYRIFSGFPPYDLSRGNPNSRLFSPRASKPVAAQDKTACTSRCGENWKEDPTSGACYQISDQLVDWPDAREHCQSLAKSDEKVELCSVLSLSENYFISSLLANRNNNWGTWIGYYFDQSDWKWKWSDGSPVSYKNFKSGQPNQNGCAYIGGPSTFSWLDTGCTAEGSIAYPCCKKIIGSKETSDEEIDSTTTSLPTSSDVKLPTEKNFTCEYPWIRNPTSGDCYRFVEVHMTWTSARARCDRLAGEDEADLASITSSEEQSFIESILASRPGVYWMGLNDKGEEGKFVWSDGTEVTYTHWYEDQPDNQNNEDCGCLWVDTVNWNDCRCNWALPAVCKKKLGSKKPSDEIDSTTTPLPTSSDVKLPTEKNFTCEYPWIRNPASGNCYIIVEDKLNWTGAKARCKSLAGEDQADLASIHSSAEQAFIINNLEKLSVYDNGWIMYWIGLNDRDEEGNFVWSDGSPVTYKSWMEGEPNELGNEDCGVIWKSKSYNWNDSGCYWENGAICKKV